MNTTTDHPHLETDEDHEVCILPAESDFDLSEHPEMTTAAHAGRVNSYREAGQKFLAFYDQVLAFILEYDNPRLAAWVIAMASGRTALTGGISQVELAERFNCTKANVSKCVKLVQARFGNSITGIEPMPGQRSMDACRKFAEIRNQQIP